MLDEKKIGNYIITKHVLVNATNFTELGKKDVSDLRISDCHFVDLCPNLKNYSYQNNSLQHIYLEALRFYYSGEWQNCNSSLEKMIRFIKDFTPANNLKKRLLSHNFTCPEGWLSYILIDLSG